MWSVWRFHTILTNLYIHSCPSVASAKLVQEINRYFNFQYKTKFQDVFNIVWNSRYMPVIQIARNITSLQNNLLFTKDNSHVDEMPSATEKIYLRQELIGSWKRVVNGKCSVDFLTTIKVQRCTDFQKP